MEKHCKACDRTLPLMDFYGVTTGRISAKCKECTKKDVRANRLVRLDYYREYDRSRADRPDRVEARKAYQKTEQGRKSANKGSRLYNQRNPERRAAVNMVNNAIRDGKLSRKPCEVCGTECAQAHHDDYSKPLDVRWLCPKHHAEHHKALRRKAA